MEYSITELSELSGVSTRTLRYYDEIGLLKPLYLSEAGYRYYGPKELEILQQILFYKERGLSLNNISKIIYNKNFNTLKALEEHLEDLLIEEKRINNMICVIKKTISSMKGECIMADKEKFEVFKKKVTDEYLQTYGKEVAEKYGEAEVSAAVQKISSMSEEGYKKFQDLKDEINNMLKEAVVKGMTPESEYAHQIVLIHKEWLSMSWSEYRENAHRGLVEMYVEDERFKKYYDREVEGCSEFLKNAVKYWILAK